MGNALMILNIAQSILNDGELIASISNGEGWSIYGK